MRALTYCKIGNLDLETYEMMKERYPHWFQKMLAQIIGYKKTLLRDLSFYQDEGALNMLDSVGLKEKKIDEKLIEHYYSVFQKLERELFEEKKSDKALKFEMEGMKNSSRKTKEKDLATIRNETKEPLMDNVVPALPSKRQNIVHLMSQSTVFIFLLLASFFFQKLQRTPDCSIA